MIDLMNVTKLALALILAATFVIGVIGAAESANMHARIAVRLQDQQERAAIGIFYDAASGQVWDVDPHSDAAGLINPGDRILAMDGCNPTEFVCSHHNFGPSGSLVRVRFEHEGRLVSITIQRKPISAFSPATQARLFGRQ